MLARTNQTNEGRVVADARAQTNLQGQTAVHARAVANEVIAGNNDIYLKLDNTPQSRTPRRPSIMSRRWARRPPMSKRRWGW